MSDAGAPEAGGSVIRFAQKLLALLYEGRFTATYKYAVLRAPMDLRPQDLVSGP